MLTTTELLLWDCPTWTGIEGNGTRRRYFTSRDGSVYLISRTTSDQGILWVFWPSTEWGPPAC